MAACVAVAAVARAQAAGAMEAGASVVVLEMAGTGAETAAMEELAEAVGAKAPLFPSAVTARAHCPQGC